MFYGWEPLRDVARPRSLIFAGYQNAYSADNTDALLTQRALSCIKDLEPDFIFLYMVETDEKGGHDNGWMSEAYLKCIHDAFNNVKQVIEQAGNQYTVIVTADHGGHDRTHGTDRKEDMTIPVLLLNAGLPTGETVKEYNIMDIAPTVATLMGMEKPMEWKGKSLVKEV